MSIADQSPHIIHNRKHLKPLDKKDGNSLILVKDSKEEENESTNFFNFSSTNVVPKQVSVSKPNINPKRAKSTLRTV